MALLVFLLLLARNAGAADATVTAPALKAAFLYNFVKFAEWPQDAAPGPLMLCVMGDAAVADALEETVQGHAIDGRDIVVSRVTTLVVSHVTTRALRGCHLLYLAGLDAKNTAAVIEELKAVPVITVGDRERFAQTGGIAGFFVEGTRMRFAINLDAAQRARVRISSRLLSLAKLVKEDRDQP